MSVSSDLSIISLMEEQRIPELSTERFADIDSDAKVIEKGLNDWEMEFANETAEVSLSRKSIISNI